MDYVEAWRLMENYIYIHETEIGHGDDFIALSMASNAMRKQIPLEPREYFPGAHIICPNCGRTTEDFDNEFEGWHYCPKCGQALMMEVEE